jgi:MFS transporter, SHS family, sialic acid transporter
MPIAQSELSPKIETKNKVGGKWMVLLAAFLGWMFDGLEMGIFPLAARPALQDLLGVADDKIIGQWMGYITALFLIGAACGGFVFGWLGDRIGRVRTMVLSILAYSIFTGLCFFANAPWQLGLYRFLAALGMGGEWSLGVALVMECWPEKHRPILAGAIGAASNFGFGLIALLGLFFRIEVDSWRWVMLAGAAPAILAFLILMFVPESERWKDSVKKGASKPMREIFSPTFLKTTLLAIAFASVALIGTWGSVQWIPLWVGKMTAGQNLPYAKAASQFAMAIGAIIGCFAGSLFGQKFGRRWTYFGLCLGSLILCAILFRGFKAYDTGLFLITVGLVGGVTAAFYGWLPLYLPELFPTRIRATGQGVSFNFGRVLAAVGALTQGQLVASYGGSYASAGSVVTLIYILGMILIWLAPETKGRPLPE